jgi:DNA-directed RNA polymerase specialized sigma24 family protein
MLKAGTKAKVIAQKLKRTVGAIHSRANEARKMAMRQKAEEKVQTPPNRLNP